MPIQINAAYRLHKILEKAQKSQGNKQTAEVWAEVLSTPGANPRRRNYEVVRLVTLLAGELDEVKTEMPTTNMSPELYQKALEKVESVLVVDALSGAWENYRTSLTEEVLLALRWCSAVLPSKENLIDEADLKELQKELSEFEKSVVDGNLPENAKAFVLHHIELIRKAITEYPVVGIKAFSKAEEQALIHFALHASVVRENAAKPEINKLSQIWGKVRKYTDEFGKVLKLLKDAKDVYDIGGGLLN